ncbi:DUF488 family protein [Tundrisphaera lichenicola]|uniref:DUF488 domain-containing protein n=1 Tax=Tundrisphaera lichenicola TaxID=2029860 RepID=UPI003EC07E0F
MKLYTIGFTKKSAETFFTKLKNSRVSRLIDVRLNNVSQLAGFTKKTDLKYFVHELCHIEYAHMQELAPTQDILTTYKTEKGDWRVYEQKFLQLMADRKIEETITPDQLDNSCLLCSEEKPHHCHRRLVAEYLRDKWGNVEIIHIP